MFKLEGKGIYIWMIRHTLDGDVVKIADHLEEAGMTHAWIKVADGSGRYNIDPLGNDRVPGLIKELRKRGIACWGWQYVYGRYPDLEARVANKRIADLKLDGFVVNAEVEYKSAGANAARYYMQQLRAANPDLPIGLSSYRFPSYHVGFPFDAFLEYCDFNAPQVYHLGANNPGYQLRKCVDEFQRLVKVQRPIFPTGAAFKDTVMIGGQWVSWRTQPAEVVEFMQTAEALGLRGYNFWELRNCVMNLPEVWAAVRDYGQVDIPEEPGEEPVEEIGPAVFEITARVLNVRSGPGIEHEVIDQLQQGDQVVMQDIGGKDAWLKVESGFVAACFGDDVYVKRVQ